MNEIKLLNNNMLLKDWNTRYPQQSFHYREVLLKSDGKYFKVGEITLWATYYGWHLGFDPTGILFEEFPPKMSSKLFRNLTSFLESFLIPRNNKTVIELKFNEVQNKADEFINKLDIWLVYE